MFLLQSASKSVVFEVNRFLVLFYKPCLYINILHFVDLCKIISILLGKIYLVGGLVERDAYARESCDGRVEVFHTTSSKWDYVPSLKEPRYNHETVALSKLINCI